MSSRPETQREELTQSSESPQAPNRPETPSMPEKNISQNETHPDISETDLKEYDESYIQIGDFEMENIPPGILEESYGDADLDGIIYHGDLTKAALDQEDYNTNTFESYENLNTIGEALDTEVYVLPGNNDSDPTELASGRDRDGKESNGRPSKNKLENFAKYLENKEGISSSGDSHEDLINNFKYLEDARDSTIGNEIDLIFMGNHFDPELNEDAYKAIFDGPDVNEFYDENDLVEIAFFFRG